MGKGFLAGLIVGAGLGLLIALMASGRVPSPALFPTGEEGLATRTLSDRVRILAARFEARLNAALAAAQDVRERKRRELLALFEEAKRRGTLLQ